MSSTSPAPAEPTGPSGHRGPITPVRAATAARARAFVHELVARDVDDEALSRVDALLAEAIKVLGAGPRLPRPVPDVAAIRRMRQTPDEPALHAMEDRPILGRASPVSVELTIRVVEGGAEAEVVFGPAFEGAPGRVHGGMVAAVFDDLLGAAMSQTRSIGFTGRLTVEYRAPVPIETPIAFRVRAGARDGRKLPVHAAARLGGRVLATADATMILVDEDHFRTSAQELLERDGPRR